MEFLKGGFEMIRVCEECGYEYSSYSEYCPRCGCPNVSLLNDRYYQENCDALYASFDQSFRCLYLTVILTGILYLLKFDGVINCMIVSGILASVASFFSWGLLKSGIFIAASMFFAALNIPEFIMVTIVFTLMFMPIYMLLVRPVIIVCKIRNVKKKMQTI